MFLTVLCMFNKILNNFEYTQKYLKGLFKTCRKEEKKCTVSSIKKVTINVLKNTYSILQNKLTENI